MVNMMVNHYGYIVMVYFMENNMFQWMIRYIHLELIHLWLDTSIYDSIHPFKFKIWWLDTSIYVS